MNILALVLVASAPCAPQPPQQPQPPTLATQRTAADQAMTEIDRAVELAKADKARRAQSPPDDWTL